MTMNEYIKAVLYCEKALKIRQTKLPLYHPDLLLSYYNVGQAYEKWKNYWTAFSFYERAVDIVQQSLLKLNMYKYGLLFIQQFVERKTKIKSNINLH